MKKVLKLVSLLLVVLLCGAFAFGCGDRSSGKIKVINIKLSDEQYAFGVGKTDDELKTAANSFIAEIKSNGVLGEILNMYFGDGTPTAVVSAKEDATKDQLIVSTNAEFAPFEYKDGDFYLGVDMEIAKRFAAKLGKELVIKNVQFFSVLTQVESGYADIAMAGLTINETRLKQVNFTDSYYNASQMVITTEADKTFDNCKTKADVDAILNALTEKDQIGGQSGTTAQSYVEGDMDDFGFPGLKAKWKGFDSGAQAVQDLINGNIKYVIIDEAPAKKIVESTNKLA